METLPPTAGSCRARKPSGATEAASPHLRRAFSTKKNQECRPEKQRYLWNVQEKVEDERPRRDHRREGTLDRGLQEPPQSLGDYGDYDRRDPVKEIFPSRRAPIPLVHDREGEHDQSCRNDKAGPGHKQAPPPCPLPTNVNRQFGGVRTRDEIGCPVQI